MPPLDIAKVGLSRDLGLKFANEASRLQDQIRILAGVDESDLSLRAFRIAQGGSALQAPGADWASEFQDPILLIEGNTLAGTMTSPVIDTRGWAAALLRIEFSLTGLLGTSAPYVRLFNFAAGTANQLVAAIPADQSRRVTDYYIPLYGVQHRLDYLISTNNNDGDLKVSIFRWPPGLPAPTAYHTQLLTGPLQYTATRTLCNFLNPRARRCYLMFDATLISGTNPTLRYDIGEGAGPGGDLDTTPTFTLTTNNYIHQFQPHGQIAITATLGGTNPVWDLTTYLAYHAE